MAPPGPLPQGFAGPSQPTPTMAGMEMVSPATSASGPSTVGPSTVGPPGGRLPFDPTDGPQIDWISTPTQKRLMVDP